MGFWLVWQVKFCAAIFLLGEGKQIQSTAPLLDELKKYMIFIHTYIVDNLPVGKHSKTDAVSSNKTCNYKNIQD